VNYQVFTVKLEKYLKYSVSHPKNGALKPTQVIEGWRVEIKNKIQQNK
jgi:hypothetical protein